MIVFLFFVCYNIFKLLAILENIILQKTNENKVPNLLKKSLHKLNNFFTLYEKIWLSFFILMGVLVAILTKDSFLFLIVLIAGLTMELTLAKRSKWCFLFVFINSTGLIIIGLITGLYSEVLINALFWIPYAIIGFILWNKNLDKAENKDLTKVASLKTWQTLSIIAAIVIVALLWSNVLNLMDGTHTVLDAFSSFFQLATGILILLRLKQQWLFWIGYIIVSATIWILLNQWIMLVISFGYLSNSIYGLISWSKYIKKHNKI